MIIDHVCQQGVVTSTEVVYSPGKNVLKESNNQRIKDGLKRQSRQMKAQIF